MAANTWYFSRRHNGHRVTVRATWVPRLELWGVICRIDGELADLGQSIEPWTDCHDMMTEVLIELGERQLDDEFTEELDADLRAETTLSPVPLPHAEENGVQ